MLYLLLLLTVIKGTIQLKISALKTFAELIQYDALL